MFCSRERESRENCQHSIVHFLLKGLLILDSVPKTRGLLCYKTYKNDKGKLVMAASDEKFEAWCYREGRTGKCKTLPLFLTVTGSANSSGNPWLTLLCTSTAVPNMIILNTRIILVGRSCWSLHFLAVSNCSTLNMKILRTRTAYPCLLYMKKSVSGLRMGTDLKCAFLPML